VFGGGRGLGGRGGRAFRRQKRGGGVVAHM
jgi:hypothetical protein